MKISYNWLKNYVNTNETPATTAAELLTFCGLEVEGVEKIESVKGGLEGVVIGEVKTCEKHPDADRLSITTIDVGLPEFLHIVCGAPNVAAGQKVAVATVGTKIWTSDTEFFEIKKSKIRGVVSEGMICAEDELNLGTSHDGIMILDPNAKIGTPAKEYFNVEEDYVFEIGLTPNRSDATSHIGVARDLVAVLNTQQNKNLQLNYPSVDEFKVDDHSKPIEIKIESEEDCPRYSGLTISGIMVKESPEWLKNRLKTIGIRPINNVVDATNFILMEMGQPLHAFDADKITGNTVIVKKLPKGSKFTTLDNVERELSGTELMICNTQGGMCIAGVFGGIQSGVTEQTKNIFIESAYFNPVSIRKTSKLHGLKTDASFRYERGCDPNITIYALKRAAILIKELAGGTISSEIKDIYPHSIENKVVELSYQRMEKLVGKHFPEDVVKTILKSLEMDILSENQETLQVSISTNKVDVTRECDLIEEILRIYGYNNIEIGKKLNSCLSYTPKPDTERIQNTISDYLSANGFDEIMNNSLTKAEYYEENPDFDPNSLVKILNPLSKDLSIMRQTLLYSGLECIAHNLNRKIANQKLYEFGKAYFFNPEQKQAEVIKKYKEEKHLMLLTTGLQIPENWKIPAEKTDFYSLKAYIENIFKRLRIEYWKFDAQSATQHFYNYGIQFIHKDSKKIIASIGSLNKKALQTFGIKQEVYHAEINWDLLLKSLPTKEIKYKGLPKFPEVRRDLALVVDKKRSFSELEKVAYETEKQLLKKVSVFDIYEGDKIEASKKSYALSFILQDEEKTLTDKQIDTVMNKLIKVFGEKLNAKIRS